MRVSDYKSRSPPTVQYRVRSYQSKEALKICMKGCFASEEHIVILTSHNAINPLCYTGKKSIGSTIFHSQPGQNRYFTGEEAFVYTIHGHTETLKWGLLNIIVTPFSYLTFTTNTTH